MGESLPGGIEAVEKKLAVVKADPGQFATAHPDVAICIQPGSLCCIAVDAFGVGGVMPVIDVFAGFGVEPVQARCPIGRPDVPFPVLHDALEPGIFEVVEVVPEPASPTTGGITPEQASLRADPQRPLPVNRKAGNLPGAQPIALPAIGVAG